MRLLLAPPRSRSCIRLAKSTTACGAILDSGEPSFGSAGAASRAPPSRLSADGATSGLAVFVHIRCHGGPARSHDTRKLVAHPRLGSSLSGFESRDVRRLVLGRYEMRYELAETAIHVLRFFHTRDNR